MTEKTEGRKDDTGKLPMDLIPVEALHGLARALQYGAAKYAPRNWEKGLQYSRPYAALLRHLTAWWDGEDIDPESGLHHLDSVLANAAFLCTFVARGRTDLDNRQGRTVHPMWRRAELITDLVGELRNGVREGRIESTFVEDLCRELEKVLHELEKVPHEGAPQLPPCEPSPYTCGMGTEKTPCPAPSCPVEEEHRDNCPHIKWHSAVLRQPSPSRRQVHTPPGLLPPIVRICTKGKRDELCQTPTCEMTLDERRDCPHIKWKKNDFFL